MRDDPRSALQKEQHPLPEGWRWEWFTDVMDIAGGTQPPANTFSATPKAGYVRLVQIRDFETEGHKTYILDSPKWRKCQTEDVLIGRYGAALGRICRGLEGAYNVALAKVVPTLRIDLDFAHQLLRSSYFQDPLLAMGGRSAQAGFNKDGLSVIPLPIPPKPEQRLIASFLSALDDKIDLNRRMNETLEAMARAIFKDWFVDFGPVRAKAEGRQPPSLAPDIAALFPDALDDEDKPVGWQALSLGRVCQLKRGYDLPTAQRESGPYPVVSSSGCSGAHSSFMAQAPGVVTGRYGTIGEVFFVEENFWPLNTALYVHDYKNNQPRFVYYMLRCVDFTRYSDKGAVPGINRNHLHEHTVVCAPPPIQNAFVQTLRPFWEKQRANQAESDTLTALRNLLLPKLMSGEIRIRDAEKALEPVA